MKSIEVIKALLMRVDFWIYIVMGVIFLSGIFLCLRPVRKIQKALRKGREHLSERRPDGSYLYNQPDFLGCRLIDDCWARFLSNLEMMQKNNAVCEVSDFINSQTVIREPGHSSFGEMIPGVLTTLGIVGSFYGIVTGLSTLDLSTTETMSQSIAVLISGMRLAFNTSIVGAVLAVIFQLMRRVIIGNAERTMRSFIRSCHTQITAMLTPEAMMMQTLHAILAELRAMSGGHHHEKKI